MTASSTHSPVIATGCYSGSGSGRGRGVELLSLDPSTGALEPLAGLELEDPSFVVWSEDGALLHVVHETAPARLSTLRVSRDARSAELARSIELGGEGACHVAVGPGARTLLVAEYGSGHAEVVGLDGDGLPTEVIDAVDHASLAAGGEAHPHQAVVLPGTDLIAVCDLGADRVVLYDQDPEGHLVPAGAIALPAGSGPRHLAADHESSVLYVACELSGRLAVIGRDPASVGEPVPTFTVRALLPISERESATGHAPSHIAISEHENHVFVADRGPDVLAVLSLGPMRPERVAEVEVGGHPRHFARLAGGLLLVATQESDRIDVLHWDGAAFHRLGDSPAPSVTCIAARPC